jgi:hypothetical protein
MQSVHPSALLLLLLLLLSLLLLLPLRLTADASATLTAKPMHVDENRTSRASFFRFFSS